MFSLIQSTPVYSPFVYSHIIYNSVYNPTHSLPVCIVHHKEFPLSIVTSVYNPHFSDFSYMPKGCDYRQVGRGTHSSLLQRAISTHRVPGSIPGWFYRRWAQERLPGELRTVSRGPAALQSAADRFLARLNNAPRCRTVEQWRTLPNMEATYLSAREVVAEKRQATRIRAPAVAAGLGKAGNGLENRVHPPAAALGSPQGRTPGGEQAPKHSRGGAPQRSH